MKKTLFFTLLTLFSIFTLFFLNSCSNEDLDNQDKADFNINQARAYFNQNPIKIKNNIYFLGKLDWEKADFKNDTLSIPLVSNKPILIKKLKNEKTSKYLYPFLLITKNKADNSFDYNLKVYFSSKINGFNESIYHLYNMNNNLISNKEKGKNTKKATNSRIVCEQWGYVETSGGVTELIYTWWVCTNDSRNEEMVPDGGGGGSTTANIVFVGPSNKISNINDYLKCFNLAQSAELIIYVDQPTANNSASWSGTFTDPYVGHTFVAIQQGGIRKVFGYYPSTNVSLTYPNDPKAFGNDQGHTFDVSLSIPINPDQLLNVIGYANNAPSTYNLNTYNCTDFAIAIGNLVGLGLPDSYGTWPGGGGSNPGQLGQEIRNMTLPTNSSRQTTGANAASNTGTCN